MPDMPPREAPPQATGLPRRRDRIRSALVAGVAFLSAFLVIRTCFLEPYGVPTGSMATAFLGNHRVRDCPRCSFPVIVGDDGGDFHLQSANCPNCGQRRISHANSPTIPGDRLMVDKNVFQLRPPRRWEVVVFRGPVDHSTPFVKRVIGLPGELLQLRDGDVFVDGVLQRKTLKQCREVRILTFDQQHAPPGGWGPRWLVETLGEEIPATPAGEDVLVGTDIVLKAGAGAARGLTYRHWNLDRAEEEPMDDALAYNGNLDTGRQLVHDFAIRFGIEARSDSGTFAVRLFDGLHSVFAEFPLAQQMPPQITFGRDGGDPATAPFQLQVGQTFDIEFSFFDRRCCLAVNGHIIPPAIDLSEENLHQRQGVSRPVQFGIRAGEVVIRNFQIYRDIYYRGDARNATHTPLRMGNDQYFMAGDNSNSSQDSREWITPGVPERALIGKPFLIHQPLKESTLAWGGPPRRINTIDWNRVRWLR